MQTKSEAPTLVCRDSAWVLHLGSVTHWQCTRQESETVTCSLCHLGSSRTAVKRAQLLLKLAALYCSWSILITSLPLAALWGTLRGRVLQFFDDTQRSGVLWSVSWFPHGTEHQPTWEGGPVPTATQQLWEKEWHLLRIEGGKPTLSKNILTFSQTFSHILDAR